MPHARDTFRIGAAVALVLSVGCVDAPEEGSGSFAAQMAERADTQAPSLPTIDASVEASIDGGSSGPHAPGHESTDDDNCPPDYPVFRGPLRMQQGDIVVTLEAADPPPRGFLSSNLTFALTDAATGAPLSSASLLRPDSYMPVHNHVGRWTPDIEVLGDGRLMLRDVDFSMDGSFMVRFGVKKDPTAQVVNVLFRICAE